MKLVRMNEVAIAFQVSTTSIKKWADSNRLHCYKIGTGDEGKNYERRFNVDDCIKFARMNNLDYALESLLRLKDDLTLVFAGNVTKFIEESARLHPENVYINTFDLHYPSTLLTEYMEVFPRTTVYLYAAEDYEKPESENIISITKDVYNASVSSRENGISRSGSESLSNGESEDGMEE
jgi:hypothetical protein